MHMDPRTMHIKMQPKLLNVNRTPHRPKRRKKIAVTFDEKKRREFLKGFHKRKLERKQQAQEKLKQQLKEERKRIRQGTQEYYKNLISNRDIPEIEQLLSQQEYETEGHTVSILELNIADLAQKNALIGENKGSVTESNESEESDNNEEIIGMALNEENKSTISKKATNNKVIENQKDFKKVVRKAALKQVKQSKVFQRKQKVEHQKNKKESIRKQKRKKKIQKRNAKMKNKLKRS